MVLHIGEIARACVLAGGDAIAAINTVPALEIVPEIERPLLGNIIGGQSGRSIRPMALRKAAEIVVALEKARKSGELKRDVPVVGIGGISSGMDAVKFMLVGAKCVQVGSHFLEGLDLEGMAGEVRDFMAGKNYGSLDDFRGNSLEWLRDVL
jgi:dihydroorotate dehydrogenase (NAD+) catalytic subunit